MDTILADASPEKRLFIALLTRDIALADAFLDLIDNSINSVLARYAARLKSASDYAKLLGKATAADLTTIELVVNEKSVEIRDKSTGIHWKSAQEHVFKFGRAAGERDANDRLSVYGVGLKRAIFKMGNQIEMTSDHSDGGFSMSLDVGKWERQREQPWTIDIERRPAAGKQKTGTNIRITELYGDVVRRIKDGLFLTELETKVRRTYAFFIGRLVRITINGKQVPALDLMIGQNTATDYFEESGVSCSISAGIGQPNVRGEFEAETAGWSVFCNGRTLFYADKTELTGWAGQPLLPLFQPKHRPFVGVVFFVSDDPEALPWTTTKAAINRESSVWQEARRRMIAVGKEVTKVLDSRYSNDGTELTKSDVQALSGTAVPVLQIATAQPKRFSPAARATPRTVRIQYDAAREQVNFITEYLRKPQMSGSEVGRYTFRYFLRNRAGYGE